MPLQDYAIKSFFGFISAPEQQSAGEGVVVDGLNWMFHGAQKGDGKYILDKIELRRGYHLLGTDAGVGKVTGLRTGFTSDGTEVLFRTRARKIEYYDTVTEDWIEVGTNSLPTAANGEDIAIEPYESLAGTAIYFSSPNSSIYKIMTANPGTLIDMSSTSFRGKMKIRNNRMFLWDRLGTNRQKDQTGLYASKLDKDSYSDYTTVTAEAIGSSGSTTYTGTLAFKAAGAKRSCFAVTFTDTSETFTDNYDGTLTGSAGGTGTINYASGVYSITFAVAAVGSVTSTYQWEDPTSGGIADFAFSATRVPGEGFYIPQGEGAGKLQNINFFNDDYYIIHERKTWKLTVTADDSDATNLPYREKVGIPNWRASIEVGDGIYYLDTSQDNATDVRMRRLQLSPVSTDVIQQSISDMVLFEDYRFDTAVVKEWGDYIVLACRTSDATQNNRIFLYDRKLRVWNPPHDYQAYTLEVYNGALHGGDSTTNNVYELYSGVDDDDSTIPNYCTLNITDLGVRGLKKTNRLVIEGEIQEDQTLKVYASYDRGDFTQIGTISGSGSYVDIGSDITIGANVLGQKSIGTGDLILANHYEYETKINSDKYENIQLKFEATGIGYVSVSLAQLKDNRFKGRHSPAKYIA